MADVRGQVRGCVILAAVVVLIGLLLAGLVVTLAAWALIS